MDQNEVQKVEQGQHRVSMEEWGTPDSVQMQKAHRKRKPGGATWENMATLLKQAGMELGKPELIWS